MYYETTFGIFYAVPGLYALRRYGARKLNEAGSRIPQTATPAPAHPAALRRASALLHMQ